MPLLVNDISAFASKRGMKLNHKKCKQMLINFLKYKAFDESQIFVDGNPVETVSSFKLLGVWISKDYSFRHGPKKGKFSLICIASVGEGRSSVIRHCTNLYFIH